METCFLCYRYHSFQHLLDCPYGDGVVESPFYSCIVTAECDFHSVLPHWLQRRRTSNLSEAGVHTGRSTGYLPHSGDCKRGYWL